MVRLPSKPLRNAFLVLALCLLAPSLAPSPGEAAAESAPVALVSRTVTDVLAVLNDKNLDQSTRRRKIEAIAYERFDFDTMSKLVVARYWKTFTPEQKAAFVTEFKAFLAHTYGERIDRYSDEEISVVSETPMKRGDVLVMTKIAGGQYGGALVEYRLRENPDAADQWRMIDVKVEGISLVLNYRDQFKSLLARGGPDELVEQLKKKNAEI